MNEVEVRLFGAFRKYIPEGRLKITISQSCDVETFKEKIRLRIKESAPGFSDENLISESALANENEILAEDGVVHAGEMLALLPPVCGG
jgi:molybdopterin converting factor small subunit